MISTYLVTGILCGIFLWIIALKKFQISHLPIAFLAVVHGMVRLFIIGTMEMVPTGVWINLLLDIGTFWMFYLWMKWIGGEKNFDIRLLVLIFSPLDILAVLSGKAVCMGILLAVLFVVATLYYISDKYGVVLNFSMFFWEYTVFSYGGWLFIVSSGICGQKLSQCFPWDREAPTLLIFSLVLLFGSVGMVFVKGIRGIQKKNRHVIFLFRRELLC
ncbi:MAG: hypothetical protein J6B10_09670 [Lachnospiraceae bacterium]|nr:hypothetical protein [Lachnospiraceae bacterium]